MTWNLALEALLLALAPGWLQWVIWLAQVCLAICW
jgi:hypothetical protein